MMIDPPSVPSAGAYAVLVRSTPPSLGAAEVGASEVAGCDAVGADADGDGLAAVPHAANTTTAPAKQPNETFPHQCSSH